MAYNIAQTQPVKIVDKLQIQRYTNSLAESVVIVQFDVLYDDNTVKECGYLRINGYDDIKALYAEMDVAIGNGLSFEEASKQVLYSRVVAYYNSDAYTPSRI